MLSGGVKLAVSGAYTEEELAEIRSAVAKVREGVAIGRLAKEIAERFDRSARGLTLAIGRELARQNPRRPKRRTTAPRSQGVAATVQKLAVLSRDLDSLGRRRRDLDKAIEARLTEYGELKARLLQSITPTHVGTESRADAVESTAAMAEPE